MKRKGQSPTTAPPGSREKIEVMTLRAAARADLFHPDDARDWSGASLGDFLLVIHGAEASVYRPKRMRREYRKRLEDDLG